MKIDPLEQARIDHLIRTLRDVARRPSTTDPMIVSFAADEAADLLRCLFPLNYSTPPPPYEGMVSLFERRPDGEG
jgi:hypothetical protein